MQTWNKHVIVKHFVYVQGCCEYNRRSRPRIDYIRKIKVLNNIQYLKYILWWLVICIITGSNLRLLLIKIFLRIQKSPETDLQVCWKWLKIAWKIKMFHQSIQDVLYAGVVTFVCNCVLKQRTSLCV